MKFGRAYMIYVQTEAQLLLPECPNVEFKKFKKLLKRCPHLLAPADDSRAATTPSADLPVGVVISENHDEHSTDCSSAATTPSAGLPVGVVISENHDEHSTDTSADLPTSEHPSSASEKSPVSCPACDAKFFPDLDKAVSEVVGCFNAFAGDLLHERMAMGIRKYFIRLRRRLAGDKTTVVQAGNSLLSYGCMNSLAVRKILKKYDKIHSSESGRAFKSRLQGRRMELLQSPLLIELGALAVNLMSSQSVPTALPQLPQAPGHHSCSFDNEKQTITYSLPDGVRLDFDLTCSICLDVVLDPVALSCGHVFCNSCACTAASVSMVLGVNSARRNNKCPICRQTGVYADAVQMAELHLLVSERCSSNYAERLPAERERRVLDAKRHWEMQTQKFLGL